MNTRHAVVLFCLILMACVNHSSPPSPPPTPSTAPSDAQNDSGDTPTGVGYVGAGIEPQAPNIVVKEVNPYQPVTIRVTGQGAAPVARSLTAAQKKLLSLRAARLDAFRAIAEEVQGMKLVGNSSVANMVSVSDSFRTYVDAYLRGVNIVSTHYGADGLSEVVAEIVLDKDFYKAFKIALQQTGSVMKASEQNAAQGVSCGKEGCLPPPSPALPSPSPYGSHYYNTQ